MQYYRNVKRKEVAPILHLKHPSPTEQCQFDNHSSKMLCVCVNIIIVCKKNSCGGGGGWLTSFFFLGRRQKHSKDLLIAYHILVLLQQNCFVTVSASFLLRK